MLRPTDFEKIRGKSSRYAVVVAVAKRARDISTEAEASGTILIEKPVSLAIQDFTSGEYKLMMNETVERDETPADGE